MRKSLYTIFLSLLILTLPTITSAQQTILSLQERDTTATPTAGYRNIRVSSSGIVYVEKSDGTNSTLASTANVVTSLNSLTGALTIATGSSGSDFNISAASSTVTLNLPTASASNRGLLSSSDWSTFNGKLSSAITSLNSLTGATQTFATGTSGTDFAISSSSTTHTFNLPTASASNRGLLSTTDWSTFNGKVSASRSITGANGLTGGGDLSADRTITLPTFGSSDGAYWVIPYGGVNGLSSGSLTTSGTIYALRFYLPERMTFTKMEFYVVTAGDGKVSAAIYDAGRTTRLAYTSPISITTGGVKTATISAVTLNPGYYWLDTVEEHNLTNTFFLVAAFSTVTAPFLNSSTVQVGSAGTATSGAILPSTPASVTDLGATAVNVIGVKLTN